MQILYGVQTTGHGHLVRSTPIIRRLRELGHDVHALLSGPPPDQSWLQRIGPPLTSRPGLTFSAEGGRVRYLRTAMRARPLRFLRDIHATPTDGFDLVITDYEPITAWLARINDLPSVGIGHLYAFAWPTVPRAAGNVLTRAILDNFAPAGIPAGSHWDDYGAPILPPTVDPEVLAMPRGPVDPGLSLVYLAFEPTADLVALLKQFPREHFHVYARVPREHREGNVWVRPLSRACFLEDLVHCRGVIANAGFTLTSECLHLGVALLVKPIAGQLEQESNALALEQLNLASVTRRLAPEDIEAWLARPAPLPQRYPDVTAALIEWLHGGAAEPLAGLSQRLWQATRWPH
jgi:uncharacterized protein (TIGR00661 family)